MAELFKQMPDSLMPYLTTNNKLDMLDFIDAGMEAKVTNKFDGESILCELDSTYLRLKLNTSVEVEMKLLSSSNILNDSTKHIICLVTTYGDLIKESVLNLFTSKWNPIEHDITKSKLISYVIHKPDTMSELTYNNVKNIPDDYLITLSLDKNENSMSVSASTTLLSTDDSTKVIPIISTKRLLWNGKTFK
jgi:hypothetical protein